MRVICLLISFLVVTCHGFAKIELNPAQIQHLINELCKTHDLPGIQICLKDTNTGRSWSFTSGYSDKENLALLKNSHSMQIGSITKSFIASLALLLEADSENGLLEYTFSIEQTIGDWLPQYPEWHSIKIKNLLNMTSGIYNYTENEDLFSSIVKEPKRFWKNDELVALAYPNIHFPDGTKFFYSNTNYILVGMILEKATGLSLEALIKERILNKYQESFKYTSYLYPLTEMAHGYAMSLNTNAELYGQDITAASLSWASAAGGLISTAHDLANWSELLFTKDFLPTKQQEELQSLICAEGSEGAYTLPKDSKSKGYGLGIGRVYDPDVGHIWTHTGGTLGYHSIFLYMPQNSLIITVIVNQIGPDINGEPDVNFIAQQIIDLVKS